MQLRSISLGSLTGRKKEEISVCPSTASFSKVVDCEEITPHPSFSELNRGSAPSATLHKCSLSRCFSILVPVLWTQLNVIIDFFYCGTQNCSGHSRWGHTSTEQSEQSPVTSWPYSTWCTSGYSWPFWLQGHTVNSYSTCHGLKLPDFSFSNFSLGIGLLHPRWRIWQLLLWNFIWLVVAQLSGLWKSLCKNSLPFRESTAPPSLALSTNIIMYMWFLCPDHL